ncbi:helix-turn-helix domain containing protein [Salmonella enterica subsp. enterica serovar Muenchen]|uniref:helix-turn-helix domain-containing protein n=1 Tax=Salmonella enterica TaxID=28901 RepID=UPI001F0FE57C|nr:helix-turn-helix domain-containing protein [Salmonella enterica]MCH5442831.1 helix-turn-helix domain containing protein [Salmonella enterica subsp. enterica serovar Muenchen]
MSTNNAEVVISRLKQFFSVTSDSALCHELGVSPQTLSSWKSRNKIPYANCVEISMNKNVSLDWLLTGRGTMYSSHGVPGDVNFSQVPQEGVTLREQKWLELFRGLAPDVQKNILQHAEKEQRLYELEQKVQELQELKTSIEQLKSAG